MTVNYSIDSVFYFFNNYFLGDSLALPLLPEWAGYLWENGRLRNLITLLNQGQGQKYVAWRVLPTTAVWQEIIQAGIQSKHLSF